jgi:hypothetical protein
MIQYLGMALLLVVVIQEVKRLCLQISNSKLRNYAVIGTSLLVAVMVMSTVLTNQCGISYTVRANEGFRTDREVFEAAAKLSAFSDIPQNSVLISSQANEVLWTNKVYLEWLGGPKVSAFVTADSFKQCSVNKDPNCSNKVGGIYEVSRSKTGGVRAVVVAGSTTASHDFQVKGVTSIARVKHDLACNTETAHLIQGWWMSKCDSGINVSQNLELQYLSN